MAVSGGGSFEAVLKLVLRPTQYVFILGDVLLPALQKLLRHECPLVVNGDSTSVFVVISQSFNPTPVPDSLVEVKRFGVQKSTDIRPAATHSVASFPAVLLNGVVS
jgi:hypothetical protein